MAKQLYTYALVKALHDQGQDYIDSFWPLALGVFEINSKYSIESIQKRLLENKGVNFPIHVLESILRRATKKGLINRDNYTYSLSEIGGQQSLLVENESDVTRRINELIKNLTIHLIDKGLILSEEESKVELEKFVNQNLGSLIYVLGPVTNPEISFDNKNKIESHLSVYLEEIQRNSSGLYQTFRDIIQGSIISATLYTDDASKLGDLERKSLSNVEFFADSNFLLSILDLHDEAVSQPAKELFSLIKAANLNILVFDFTLDEIASVLSGYISEAQKYPPNIKIESIYSVLKRNGWNSRRVRDYILNLDREIEKIGISIKQTTVNLENYKADNADRFQQLTTYKQQTSRSRNHDVAAIEQIIRFRKNRSRGIELCKAIFLTEDSQLNRFVIEKLGHIENFTIPETITERALTELLWLKNPKINLPLSSIISAHGKGEIINRKIWEKFYQVLEQMEQSGQVSEEDIYTVFYYEHLEKELGEMHEGQEGEITQNKVLEYISSAKNIAQKEKQEINDEFKTYKEKLENIKEELKVVKDQGKKKITDIREKLQKSSKKRAKVWAYFFRIISLGIFICISEILGGFGFLWKSISVLIGIFSFFGFEFRNLNGVWGFLENKIAKRIYENEVRFFEVKE